MNTKNIRIILGSLMISTGVSVIAQNDDGQNIITKTGVTITGETIYARQKISIKPSSKLKTGTKLIIKDVYYEPLPSRVMNNGSNTSNGDGTNFIFTQTFRNAITDVNQLATGINADVIENVQYFDGLGRPLQSIDLKAGPNNEDIIVPIQHNAIGLEEKKYLPFAASGDGQLRTNAVSEQASFYSTNGTIPGHEANAGNAYTFIGYENSPLNRVLSQTSPGSEFAGHQVAYSYGSNTAAITRWTVNTSGGLVKSGTYAIGTLYKIRTMDEDGKAVTEYRDKLGRVILKEGELSAQTFYVYDDSGLLRYVLPPASITELNGATSYTDIIARWCYNYQYDERGRMIVKKLPEVDAIYMVYDKADRLVLTQDGVLRPYKQWIWVSYDALGRAVRTCLITNNYDRPTLQTAYNATAFANYETRSTTTTTHFQGYTANTKPAGTTTSTIMVLSVNYYDDYDFDNNGGSDIYYVAENGFINTNIAKPKGMLTCSKTFIFPACTTFVQTTQFYDTYGRPKQTQTTDHLGITERTTSAMNLLGEVQMQRTIQSGSGISNQSDEYFTYDQRGRVLTVTQMLNNFTKKTLVKNTYNQLGELVKELHLPDIMTGLQKVDYSYNIRGWLTGINPVNTPGENDLFNMKLYYTEAMPSLSNRPQFNGNISGMQWRTAGDDAGIWQAYGFRYDKLNRLTDAIYGGYTQTSNTVTPESTIVPLYIGRFNEQVLQYDLNGNIKQLCRSGIDVINGGIPSYSSNLIDVLTYDYGTAGNQLQNVADASIVTQNLETGNFIDGNTTTTPDYAYDKNGNLTKDLNKGIAEIRYNILNLPSKVVLVAGQKFIDYIYTASGALVQKKVTNNGVVQYTENYLGNYVYKTMGAGTTVSAADLSYISTAKGRWVKNATGFYAHEFYLQDHLGNTRVVYCDDNNDGLVNTTTEVKQYASYYPFGMLHNRYSTVTDDNRKLYNGKEFQSDLNLDWYDYGARMYDAQIGRWMVIDPMVENGHHNYTPYAYVYNNPLRFIDPFGLDSADAAALTQAAENSVDWVKENYGTTSAQCNRGVNHAFKELTGNDELSDKNANDMVDQMENSDNFEEVDRDDVQEGANDGEIIIAGKKESSGSGHVALAVPGEEVSSTSWEGSAPVGMDTGKNKRWSSNGMNYSWSSPNGVTFYKYTGSSSGTSNNNQVYYGGTLPAINIYPPPIPLALRSGIPLVSSDK